MAFASPTAIASLDPVDAVLAFPDGAVLCVISGVEGPSYRPIGAMMAVMGSGTRVGTLSSGCIERDIRKQCERARETRQPLSLRYGRGSPYADLALPCGGGLDILLLPFPDQAVLTELQARRRARIYCSLVIDVATGAMRLEDTGGTGRTGTRLNVRFEPPVCFLVFGKGPEAATFSALTRSAGHPQLLLSPDDETLIEARESGCEIRPLVSRGLPPDLSVDPRTAIVLFFHDHEWEPPILSAALATPAFYIGAQGSQRARDARVAEMAAMGISNADLARLHGPVGLIPSTRDPVTLAVSVFAEILAIAMATSRPEVQPPGAPAPMPEDLAV